MDNSTTWEIIEPLVITRDGVGNPTAVLDPDEYIRVYGIPTGMIVLIDHNGYMIELDSVQFARLMEFAMRVPVYE